MLTLICPGLLGPIPAAPETLPKVSAIDRLLARADLIPAGGHSAGIALLRDVGVSIDPDEDAPTASLSLLGEASDARCDGYWMHADPVHLRPDRDRLLLFAGEGVAPDRAEADALVALFNSHFAADGLRLTAPHPNRWYLKSDRILDLRTETLERVVGGPVPIDLPSGADARRWRGLMNEVQMLFYGSEVNRLREQVRRPAISGIWTWGGGVLPERSGEPPDAVIGDDPLTAGLARWCGVAHRSLEGWSPQESLPGRRQLVLWDRLGAALLERDLAGWSTALEALEGTIAVLEARIKRRGLDEVRLDPCEGIVYRLTRSSARRFWRRGGLAEGLVRHS
ncbi:phosphoglycerate mutase [Thiocapsa bogorovii]|uniref:phosphoglycerate mutase n=1 Tax=Thiocapsa bogorovii TaxID=521689 RepID=UPI001E2C78E2|nr:phosphoglycerate mutase [Thiocapsa bogorovii]UHD17181.1 phosphoglycerate mutase [Thiocapsa bogorovii]